MIVLDTDHISVSRISSRVLSHDDSNGIHTVNLAVNLTEQELTELRQRTNASDSADAVTRAAREFLRTSRSRELATLAGDVDYDENAWRELDEAELSQPHVNIEANELPDG